MADTYSGECKKCGIETDLILGQCFECSSNISLGQWAKKNNIKWRDAINWARRGRLKTAKKVKVEIERWEIDSNEPKLK